jgi:hypothetical protein
MVDVPLPRGSGTVPDLSYQLLNSDNCNFQLTTAQKIYIYSIIACSLVAEETICPQICSLATALVMLPIYAAVTWQLVYMSQYRTVHMY